MKKTLLLAAALFATSSAFALDMYVIGADVNGKAWELLEPSGKMTETASGVYEWNGQTLGDSFKINDGTWNATYNIGAGDDGNIKLGTAYHYYMGDGSGDIHFDGFNYLTNPKIVLNMNDNTIVLTGTVGEAPTPDPGDLTFYIIGSNVNGQSWALAQADAAFTEIGNGVYQWEGKELGTGFKINDGTWSNGNYNIGSAGSEISMNEPFYYWADGGSGNIAFAGFTTLKNPVVELDLNDETITLKGGTPEGVANWYITGINGTYELTKDWMLSQVGTTNVYTREVFVVEQTGKCKVSDDGWAHQFGTNFPEEVFINAESMEVQVEPVNGEGGDVPYELAEGNYTVKFDLDELILSFTDAAGVETVVMGNEANAVYYNLHGQKVNNPEKGIFVKVVNGKSVKVVK